MLTTLAYAVMQGSQVESVSAQGRYWNFQDANHNPWNSNGNTLAGEARYRDGPCVYANSATCEFETRTLRISTGGNILESITAYGRLFDFVDNAPVTGTGQLLSSMPLYAPVCAYASTTQPCHFDARSVTDSQFGLADVVFAYGRMFAFVQGGLSNTGGTLLDSFSPYSAACVGVPSGTCTIDSYEVTTLVGHTGTQEVFTAYGKLYIYDRDAMLNATALSGYPVDLRSVPRFRDGPCMGQ